MSRILKNFLCTAALFFFAIVSVPVPANSTVIPCQQLLTGELNVTFPTSGTANLTWTEIPGTSLYLVEVYDLTTSQTITSFYTGNTYATVSSLPSGHRGRFSVTRGSTSIIIDVIME